MNKPHRMSDEDYAANLYCHIFGVEEDGDDANTRRILDALNTLTERERISLECRFRECRTLEQTREALGGVGNERVRQIQAKAIRKLRHPARVRDMSVAQIEATITQ